MHLRRGIIDSEDPYRLLILRERHGFTLRGPDGRRRPANRYDRPLAPETSEGCNDFKFWHTRRDVDWIDPLVPPGQVEKTEEDWLLVILLGRPANSALDWLPATRGEIDPEGWYQLAAGEFYVYYAPGCKSSEKGGRLPLAFPVAIAKLLTPEYNLLRRTLNMRFTGFCDTQGHEGVVRTVDHALRSLTIFGVADLDARRADTVMRRAYRRNDALTRAFFDFRTENLKNAARSSPPPAPAPGHPHRRPGERSLPHRRLLLPRRPLARRRHPEAPRRAVPLHRVQHRAQELPIASGCRRRASGRRGSRSRSVR